jgi:hypothetical protein
MGAGLHVPHRFFCLLLVKGEETMRYAEAMVKTMLSQSIGETAFLEKALEQRRFDLSEQETLEFVGRLIASQVRALYYLAGQIDDLQAAVSRGQQ